MDSGVHAEHPHVDGVSGGVVIDASGVASGDYVDRLGHGTAVTAAIKEKAPAAELFAVKVFDLELSTSSAALGHAIDWSASQDARLVNLSLGTVNPAHEDALAAAVVRAQEGGALIVSAEGSEGKRWLPGSLPGVVGVRLDWHCPRDAVRISTPASGRPLFLASGYPRPIPGVPSNRNLQEISFAVANVTGILARLLEGTSTGLTVDAVVELGRELAAGRDTVVP